MRIGIVSDTHGRLERLEAAMEIFAARKVDAIVHCGDVGSSACMEALAQAKVPAYATTGNMDGHSEDIKESASFAGVHVAPQTIQVPLGDGQYLVATHGHEQHVLTELLNSEEYPYVCHGHTHRQRDERIGKVRVINPGALFNPRHPSFPTVAILDTAADDVEFIEVPR